MTDGIPAEYQGIVADLIPLCAAAIDAVGGLCRMDVVCSNAAVREVRAKLPKQDRGNRGTRQFSADAFRMTKLLGAEEEFFTILDSNDKICTALAYEAGLVNSQKQITPAGRAHLDDIKKQTRDENDGTERPPTESTRKAPAKPKSGSMVKGKGKGSTVRTAGGVQLSIQKTGDVRVVARKLYDAVLSGTDTDFNELVLEARKARKGRGAVPQKPIGRTTAMRPNANSGQTQQRVGTKRARETTKAAKKVQSGSDDQLREVERLMRSCVQVLRKEPEQKMKLCHLADADQVKSQRSVLNGVSFGRVFDTAYPQFFECDKDSKNQMYVKLTEEPQRCTLGQCPPAELPAPFKKRRVATEGDAQD